MVPLTLKRDSKVTDNTVVVLYSNDGGSFSVSLTITIRVSIL